MAHLTHPCGPPGAPVPRPTKRSGVALPRPPGQIGLARPSLRVCQPEQPPPHVFFSKNTRFLAPTPPKNRPHRFLHPFAPLSLLLGHGRGPATPACPPSRVVHLPELATAVVPIRSTSCRRRAGVRRHGEPLPFLSPLLPASLSFLPRRAPACMDRPGAWRSCVRPSVRPASCAVHPCPWPARLARARGQRGSLWPAGVANPAWQPGAARQRGFLADTSPAPGCCVEELRSLAIGTPSSNVCRVFHMMAHASSIFTCTCRALLCKLFRVLAACRRGPDDICLPLDDVCLPVDNARLPPRNTFVYPAC
jgi:hypothetical protein